MKTREQIRRLFPKGVSRLVPLREVEPYKNYANEARAGITSDDTAFMRAAMDSLVTQDGFELGDQGTQMIRLFDEDPRGYGGTTKRAIDALRHGRDLPPDDPRALGSGPSTRLFPIVAWMHVMELSARKRAKIVEPLTRQTHPNRQTVLCSQIHAKVLGLLLQKRYTPQRLLEKVIRNALSFE
jgi:ADP-ribosylglycohydrolase